MFKPSKIIIIAMIMSLIVMSQSDFAQRAPISSTIYATSMHWQDENKSHLLKLAPTWPNDVVFSLFDAYQHPEQFKLPHEKSSNKYNVQFINSHWGPLNNPFIKYRRPVKAFVMFGNNNISAHLFYMAPLIKNELDQEYYVFVQEQTKPITLKNWVEILKAKHPEYPFIKFNVCHVYGNLPTEQCDKKSYSDETENGKHYSLNQMSLTAQREPTIHWRSVLSKNKLLLASSANSILETSIDWKDQAMRNSLLNTVTAWPNYQTIEANFKKIRDLRYLQDEEIPNFARRISWLYPDDGCWTRASAVIHDLFGPHNNLMNHFARPSKIFAFGDLCAITNNEHHGRVMWWYHTAPIVRDAETNQTYVLDPSVDAFHPMTTENWITTISSRSGSCINSLASVETFNICNGYGNLPNQVCNDTYRNETSAMLLQNLFLQVERERQNLLGRDANLVLGDSPPWM